MQLCRFVVTGETTPRLGILAEETIQEIGGG